MDKEKLNLSLSPGAKSKFVALASKLGYQWGDRGNPSALVDAIAFGELAVGGDAPPIGEPSWNEHALLSLLPSLDFVERYELAQELQSSISRENENTIAEILDDGVQLQKVFELIEKQQPFRLFYQDAAGQDFNFTVRYAQLTSIEQHTYLECWCEETEGNRDLEELRHNWSFRPERIASAELIPVTGDWLNSGLDKLNAEFYLFGGLAHAFEAKANDSVEWITAEIPTKHVVRSINSSFWFIREILRYGKNCKIVSPPELRDRVADEIKAMAEAYG